MSKDLPTVEEGGWCDPNQFRYPRTTKEAWGVKDGPNVIFDPKEERGIGLSGWILIGFWAMAIGFIIGMCLEGLKV